MPDLTHSVAFHAVVGAIHNTLHSHPRWSVPKDFARSVAKRAAGTLMAHEGSSVLAATGRATAKTCRCFGGRRSTSGAPPPSRA